MRSVVSPGAAKRVPFAPRWQAGVVVQRRGVRAPRDYLADGGLWPQGPWVEQTPRSVTVAAAICTRLREAIEGHGLSNTAAAARIGVSRQALQDILGGRRFPDMQTVVQAEDAFGVGLWPARR